VSEKRDRAITGTGRFTFPYSGPENVTVVNVHHDPLPVQWILIDGSTGQHKRSGRKERRGEDEHVTAGVVAGDVATLAHLVIRAGKWAKAGPDGGGQWVDGFLH
jgi:hypothetical protein